MYMRILIVEDNVINILVITGMLTKYGLTTVTVNNGAQALEHLKKQTCDVILMDIEMPVMDGRQATKIIRQQEQRNGGHIPIIAVTGHVQQEYQKMLLTEGFDGHVAKPYNLADITAELHRVTSKPYTSLL